MSCFRNSRSRQKRKLAKHVPVLLTFGDFIKMAKLTKEEFRRDFHFNSIQAVLRLIREKKIRLNKDGEIDTLDEFNAPYCQKREERVKKELLKTVKTKAPKQTTKQNAGMSSQANSRSRNTKSADQLALEIDLLNARLEEKQQKSELTRLKIAKEKREVIEVDVLNRCIQEIFADMIKRLTEIPSIYAIDIIKKVQSEEQPKELIVEFLTQKITNTIKQGLQSAKTAAKKYYEGENDE